jgi:predicted DNA-binding transcriptional regulator AlpA
MLGVSRPSVWRYVRRDDFPEPEAQVSGKRLWKRATVQRWAKQTLPLKFDPRSKRR